MKNAGLDEAQAGIKIFGRNINNLRWGYFHLSYADDSILMSESEELKSLDESEKEERKIWLKAQY